MFTSFFVAALLGSVSAITDTNCTVNGAYSANAAACDNVQADSACDNLFPDSLVAPGGEDERPVQCFNGTNGPSEEQKKFAIDTCPKTCGYCCQTTAYDCADATFPRINCDSITRTMCNDANWKTVIAADCPSACGFCNEGGCIDAVPSCTGNLCITKGLEVFVAANCQRTCNLCTSTTGTSSTCTYAANTNANCATWNANGFCSSTYYTDAVKKQYCATTCQKC